MFFNSIDFAVFLPIVFVLYWSLNKNLRLQNLLIIVASFVFYGWWDAKFLLLITITILSNYYAARMSRNGSKFPFIANIILNFLILGYFKYCNFFIQSFATAFSFFGINLDVRPLSIILPIGISFYTFQAIGYSIDVYKKKIEPAKDIISFFAFVSFFPLLVAGPIERANNLLPQFCKKRFFEYEKAVDGCRQILLGLFKKIVVADTCAVEVNYIFSNAADSSGSTLLLGGILFAFQIYGDFSGYSDIAVGVSRLFGINAMKNFAFPYFSRDIAEFWRRWHISLTTWFRDYIYIPLGGSRCSTLKQIRNTFAIFLISGFWHGANWTFILWGCGHAVLFLPLLLAKSNRKNMNDASLKDIGKIACTFLPVSFMWLFFRAENIAQLWHILNNIFSFSLFSIPNIIPQKAIIFSSILFILEWHERDKKYALEKPRKWYFYYILLVFIWYCAISNKPQAFIYFQF
jgi:D-alanyl-lipoteichoic acid acyltransferase DltB (MBOAT superfamily)